MKAVSIILFMIMYASTAFCSSEKVDYEQYKYQTPKLIDCQKLNIDEIDMGGTKTQPTICFYDVVIGQNQHILMWHNMKTHKIGFTEHKN